MRVSESLDVLEPLDEAPAAQAPGSLDLRLLLLALRRGLPLTLLLVVLGTAAGYAASRRIQSRYQAQAVLLRHNKNTSVNPDIYFEPSLRTLLETVKLRGNLEALKARLGITLTDEQLFKSIEVKPGNRSEIIQIVATAERPELAAEMANGISLIFQRSSAGVSRSVAERVWRFRTDQRAALVAELNAAQNRLAAFQKRHQVSFFSDTTRLLLEQIKQFELDQSNARLQLQRDRLGMAEMARELGQRPENIRVTSTVRHRTRVRYDELQNELKALLERYTEDNPKVISLRDQLSALEKQMAVAGPAVAEEESFGMDPVVRELKIRHAELAAGISGSERQVDSLGKAIQQQRQQLTKLAALEKDYDNLRREVDRVSENLRENDFRLAEATNAMRSNISSFDVVEPATPPATPLPTGRKLLLGGGLGLGLLLGLALPLGRELADLRIKSPRQFPALGLDYLGWLPRRTPRSQPLYYQQWLLLINRLLLRLDALPAAGPKLLLVAAVKPGEGRHFVSEQLLDTLRFRGGQVVHIRPAATGDASEHDLSPWLQSRDALLPFPLRSDSQTQLYTTTLSEQGPQYPLLVNKLPELLARHSQASYLIWELPPLQDHRAWLLMLAPLASALVLISRFRGPAQARVRRLLDELQDIRPDLPRYGLLNQVPWAWRRFEGGV
ncbi:MAG: GumC family protein [Candidatus Sericytochromatia bacterium]